MRFESSNVQLVAAEKLQGEGMAALRKGNLKVAIDKFTEAINMQPPILMTLLDSRAALYDKTDQLKLALKDAKRMMEHEKANPKGYLRAGKILHRMDKSTMAVEIYKLGIKHIEPSDPHLPRLKEMIEKALEKQNKALKAARKKIYDPMQVLPLELLEMVLEYLPFSNIVAMQRVSKTWQNVISSNARFWATLDFSHAKKPISRSALKNCINKSKYTLTKATLNRIHNFNDTTVIDMVSVCKDLEYMKVMDGFMGSSLTRAMELTKSLKTLILHCQIPYGTFEALINTELPLEHLECLRLGPIEGTLGFVKKEPCLALKRLLVNFAADGEKQRSMHMGQLIPLLPNVQELQLCKIKVEIEKIDLTTLERLEIFVCRHSELRTTEVLYPVSLQILDLSNTSFSNRAPNLAINQETLYNLKRLNLTKSDITVETLLELIPPHETQLTHLRIGFAKFIGFEILAEHYFNYKLLLNLVELSVEGDYEFSHRTIKDLYYLPSLKRLNFSVTSLNGAGAYQFIRNTIFRYVAGQWLRFSEWRDTNLIYRDHTKYRRSPFLWGLVLLGASTAMFCIGNSIPILVAARLIQGMPVGCIWVVGLALVIDTVPANEQNQSLGYVAAGITAGSSLGPLLGGVIYAKAGYVAVFILAFGVIGVDIILWLWVIERAAAKQWQAPAAASDDLVEGKDPDKLAKNEETVREKILNSDIGP
ncbi:hypothetical protein H072_2815 [Dactylellina haptotyla CBS 200.50]|uniref:F-box domain-containing protein n=1 Tax=Dactylellina haptotyla (strain CBS 200.50) TaxID=1284197 RepID=S8C650_DACHA|nr:hypothetical protein H072_2815 [Dactylellina haptotyla CBS 200.50]